MSIKITDFETIQTLYDFFEKHDQEKTIDISPNPTFGLVEFISARSQRDKPVLQSQEWNYISFVSGIEPSSTKVKDLVVSLKPLIQNYGSAPALLDNKLIKRKLDSDIVLNPISQVLFWQTDMNPYTNADFFEQLKTVGSILQDTQLMLIWLRKKIPAGLQVFFVNVNEIYFGIEQVTARYPNIKDYVRLIFTFDSKKTFLYVSGFTSVELTKFNDFDCEFDRVKMIVTVFGKDNGFQHKCLDITRYMRKIKELLSELESTPRGQPRVQVADKIFDCVVANKDFLEPPRYKLFKQTIQNKLIELSSDSLYPHAKDYYYKIFGVTIPE